ncbi:2-C-methyl-D-erythritol 4-phosphate cytidylyltransferase [Clostridioides difficile]
MVENIGQSVTMVMGSYENIKITSPEDLNIAEQILNMEKRDEVNSRRRII